MRAAWLLLLTFVAGCGLSPPTGASTERSTVGRAVVRTTRVSRGDITGVLTYTSDLRAKPVTTVMPRVSGVLRRLHVETGSPVREGDALAELDRAGPEATVVQNQVSLAAAEARLAELRANDVPEARAEAEARLRAAQARLESLEGSPRADTIAQLVQKLREARRRLAELESNNADAMGQAAARLATARSRLDQVATTEPTPSPQPAEGESEPPASPTPLNRRTVEQARGEIRRAEDDLSRARRPIAGEEIVQAREDVARAEDELLQTRNPVHPSELQEARANVEAAEVRLRRDAAPATPAQVKAGEAAVDHAWAALELARLQLREATILAPIGGVVAETHHRQGTTVAAGGPLVTIQPLDFELVLPVEDRHLAHVQVGQGVTVVVDAYPGESFNGIIKNIAPTVETRTRTVAARVDVIDPHLKLKGGLFAQAAIPGARRTNTLLVPREAIVAAAEASVMQVVDGRARRSPVQLGVNDGRNVEILQGVAEGAEVILSPAGLMDGESLVERAS